MITAIPLTYDDVPLDAVWLEWDYDDDTGTHKTRQKIIEIDHHGLITFDTSFEDDGSVEFDSRAVRRHRFDDMAEPTDSHKIITAAGSRVNCWKEVESHE